MKIKLPGYLLFVFLLCCGKPFMAAAQSPATGTVTFQYQTGANQVVSNNYTYADYVPTGSADAGLGFEFVAQGTGTTFSKYAQVGYYTFSGNDGMIYFNRSSASVTVTAAYIMSAATGATTTYGNTLPTPGGQFDLTSIDLEEVSSPGTVNIQAYRNGVAIGSPVTTPTLSISAKTTINLSANANFADIDEIAITGFNGDGIRADNITTLAAVVNPTVTVTTTPAGCGGGNTTFTASGGTPTGGTYNWYLNSSGSTAGSSAEANTFGSGTGTNPSTYTVNLTSSRTYYVSYKPSAGVETGLTAVTATIKDYPFAHTNTTGLSYQYTFSGNANDASGNNNNGTVNGGATLTSDRFGVSSNAYLFDGSTGNISTATQIASPGPQVFTINVWFNTTTAGGKLIGFGGAQTGNSGNYDRHIYMNNAGQLIFGIYNGATDTIRTGTSYNDGTWHMVTASLSSAGMKLYVDGVLKSSNITYYTPQVYAGYWRIGYDNLTAWPDAPTNFYFTGTLDDIDIYSRELTANEVYSLLGAEVRPVCVGGTLSFSANTNTGSTYTWSGPSSFASTAQNPTITSVTAANTGNYTVTVKGTDGCTSVQTIYGSVQPLPDASFTAPANAALNTTTTLTLGTAYNTGLYTYSYSIGDGSLVTLSGTNFQVTWPTTGTKTISLTVTNIATGCTSTYSTTLVVSNSVTSANYAFSQPVTLNSSTSGISTTLTNFPALVYIKEDALKAGAGYVQNCANNVQFPTGGSNGYDFAFTLNGSTAELPYQVSSYDATTGTLSAWVQIPSVSASSNVALTFYFGSTAPNHSSAFTASTWPSDYVDVYHMDENSASATVLDATVATNNAIQTSTTPIAGKIGYAYSFNGSSSEISTSSVNNNVLGSFTLSAWVNSTSFTGHTDQKVVTNQYTGDGGYKLSLYGTSATNVYTEVETRSNSSVASSDRTATGGTALSANTWYYVQGVFDASTSTFYSYVNGVLDRSLTGAISSGSNGKNLVMGTDLGNVNWFYGIIDECRVSNIAKSADWIKEEYYNQNTPTTYTTAGTTITTNTTNATALGTPGGAIVYTWTGTGGTGLSTLSNWKSSASGSPNQVPPFDGTCSLIIPNGAPNYPLLTANESIYGLTLGAAATINLNGFTLNVGCYIYNNAAGASQILYGTSTGNITFNGSMATQYFYGNGSTTTSNLANLTLNNSAAGTLDITGGNVNIYNSLTITKGNILVDNAGSGALTLISQASGTANVNTIPSPYTIKGNVTAQRYFPGGATGYRTYRLLTLPVNISSNFNQNTSSGGSEAYIDLHSLNGGLITAGPGSGFSYLTKIANPLIYLYDENRAQNFTAYVAGKNVGIYTMTGSPSYNIIYYPKGAAALPAPTATAQVPVGNSVQLYYVGPYVASPVLTATAPAAATSSATGYLNQGTISTYIFSTNSTTLSYSPTVNTLTTQGLGLNQVGNPYASTIDLDSLYYDNKTGTNAIGPMFWELKQPNNTFVAYSGNHTSSTTGSEAYIASGQGFYAQAISNTTTPSITTSKLTFYEQDKVNVNIGTSTSPVLILNQKSNNSISAAEILPSGLPGLHLQIMKDTATYTQTGIYFNPSWNDKYSPVEDAVDLDGTAPKVYLSSYSSDGARLCINGLGNYTQGKTVKLYASATTSGTFTISLADIKNVDALYNVYLRDHKLNDSVNLRNTNAYTFTINTGDTSTYGANRFDLVLERQALPPYKLLNFTGQKVTSGVQLNWAANNTGNYTGFILQKQGTNNTFNPLYTVQSSTNSSNYNFVDSNPTVGNNIYRLAQNDVNGNITYSSLITIGYDNVSSNGYFSVYPNPSKDIINILVNSTTATAANYTADIYNTSGTLMDHRILNTYTWTQDISNYKEGVYIIALKNTNGEVLAKSKFIKTK